MVAVFFSDRRPLRPQWRQIAGRPVDNVGARTFCSSGRKLYRSHYREITLLSTRYGWRKARGIRRGMQLSGFGVPASFWTARVGRNDCLNSAAVWSDREKLLAFVFFFSYLNVAIFAWSKSVNNFKVNLLFRFAARFKISIILWTALPVMQK